MIDYKALYQAEKAKRAGKVTFSYSGRPVCQYCGHKEAQYTGKRRKGDNSKVMRKFKGKYECGDCHSMRLFHCLPPVKRARTDDDSVVCY